MTNIRFAEGDVHHLAFDRGAFDLVTCRRAAHHFSDIKLALREIARVLRPGGRFVVDDRSVPADQAADAALNHLDVLHDSSHVREYSAAEWAKLLAGAGFAIESIETYTRHRALSAFTDGVDAAGAGPRRQNLPCQRARRAMAKRERSDARPAVDCAC